MNYIKIIVLLIVFLGLRYDYKKDIGLHKKAKIYHAIFLSIIILFVSGFSRIIMWIIRDFSTASSYISKDFGIIPGEIFIISSISDIIISGFVFFVAFRLITKRRKKEIKRLIYALPIIVVTSTINLYRVVIEQATEQEINDLFILISGIIIFGLPSLIIINTYKKGFMKDFINYSTTEKQK